MSEGGEKDEDDAAWAKAVTAGKMSKGDKLAAVDHSTIEYPPFRRNFYIEVRARGGVTATQRLAFFQLCVDTAGRLGTLQVLECAIVYLVCTA